MQSALLKLCAVTNFQLFLRVGALQLKCIMTIAVDLASRGTSGKSWNAHVMITVACSAAAFTVTLRSILFVFGAAEEYHGMCAHQE
jgi:hypothetical protein